MSFKCVPSCPVKLEAQTRRGLNLHQNVCKAAQAHFEKADEVRAKLKARKAELLAAAKAAKRAKTHSATPLDQEAVTDPQPQRPDLEDVSQHSEPALPQDLESRTDASAPDPPPTPVRPSGRPARNCGAPKRYQDIVPQGVSAAPVEAPTLEEPPPAVLPRVTLYVRNRYQTLKDTFGCWRTYLYKPSYDPTSTIPEEELYNAEDHSDGESLEPEQEKDAPDPVERTFSLLSEWSNTGSSTKSNAELSRLVSDYLLHPEFNITHFKTHRFNPARENARLDYDASTESPFPDHFKPATVYIDIPSGVKDKPPIKFPVPGLYYRKLTSVIQEAFTSPIGADFHYTPFTQFRTSPTTGEPERIYSELYNSDAFIEEHDRLQREGQLPPDAQDCKREKVIAGMMLWSDSTHLANFGTAKLWPVYLYFGNLSKYVRGKTDSGACQHVAYMPSLPDSLEDVMKDVHPSWKTQKKALITHCRRELLQAVWALLLDDEFVHAYKYGMVIRCPDGIERRVYPRIFTYSADYPEKVLLATIRDKGLCACPRCMMLREMFHLMGLNRDLAFRLAHSREYPADLIAIARKAVYEQGRAVAGSVVDRLLKPISAVPTENAFVKRLGPSFPLSRMLVVDFLHEFELGVWKSLFTHLMRILHAASSDESLTALLDERYRKIPTFGIDTIRRFANNASEMKKLAGRDFEDLLQCAIPVFEGLLPAPHGEHVAILLYRMAEWHGLAKMRLHTDETLARLEVLTKELGQRMRKFQQETCTFFTTYELPRESAARARREQAQQTGVHTAAPAENVSKRERKFNLNTYKWHALGDYVAAIRAFGGTDGFSTQLGELAHRVVKRLYGLTNKRAATAQIASRWQRMYRAQQAWQRRLLKERRVSEASSSLLMRRTKHKPASTVIETEEANPEERYYISPSRRNALNIRSFVHGRNRQGDLAFHRFLPKLQDHILGRLLGRDFEGDTYGEFSTDDQNTVRIVQNQLFSVKTCRLFYTTYDLQRTFDLINPTSHPDVMVLSPETTPGASPYWYARVIGIYHALVWTTHPGVREGREPRRIDFLWVRWLGTEPGYQHGIRRAKLPKIGFVEAHDDYAFGFLDPAQVVRGCHLIPDFESGRTEGLLPCKSSAARVLEPDSVDDWTNFYVNIFVDRDMLMRYMGNGVGHSGNGASIPNENNHDGLANLDDDDIWNDVPEDLGPCPPGSVDFDVDSADEDGGEMGVSDESDDNSDLDNMEGPDNEEDDDDDGYASY